MREAAARTKLLREEAKSGLGRLDHDDQTELVDLPRDGREECHGSNGGRGEHTGTGRAAVAVKIVPISPGVFEGA